MDFFIVPFLFIQTLVKSHVHHRRHSVIAEKPAVPPPPHGPTSSLGLLLPPLFSGGAILRHGAVPDCCFIIPSSPASCGHLLRSLNVLCWWQFARLPGSPGWRWMCRPSLSGSVSDLARTGSQNSLEDLGAGASLPLVPRGLARGCTRGLESRVSMGHPAHSIAGDDRSTFWLCWCLQ